MRAILIFQNREHLRRILSLTIDLAHRMRIITRIDDADFPT